MKKTFLLILSFFCFMSSFVFGNPNSKQVIILLGAPGAGKGTQAQVLKEITNFPHISTGDLFRENLKGNTPIGQKAKSYMEKGALVPDEVVFEMLFDRLNRDDCAKGYILDGFPRSKDQAKVLDEALKGKADILVLDIEVPDQMIIDRLVYRLTCEKCQTPYHAKFMPPKQSGICDRCGGALIQRKDDTEEVIKNRLEVYHNQTEPLIEYYKEQGKLIIIDGTKAKDQITKDIVNALKKVE